MGRGRARIGAAVVGIAILAALLVVSPPSSAYVPRAPIVISGNADFTPANGVTGGSGTPSDPYVIEGWEIDGSANSGIEVWNTDAHFVIRNVYVHSSLIDAIYFYDVRNGRVENSTVTGNDGALYLEVSSHIAVVGNNISFNALDAILLDWSHNVTVERNQMWGNGDWGVFTYEADDLVVRGNRIASQGSAGIEFNFAERVAVERNTVHNNMAGLIVDFSSDVTILDNTFSENEYNVDLTNSVDVLIRGNTVEASASDGITINRGTRLTIEENVITGTGVGVGVGAVGVTGLLVRHNAFDRNVPQASDDGGAENAWDDGYPSGGNHWSDYTGVDNCRGPGQDDCTGPDGIGDTPYGIDADTQDRYPLMAPPGPERFGAAPASPPTIPPITFLLTPRPVPGGICGLGPSFPMATPRGWPSVFAA